jgi:hypothetical protein
MKWTAGAENWQKRDVDVRRDGKRHPPYYGTEYRIIGVKEKNGEAGKEKEEGKVYHDPQALYHQ